MEFRILGPLEVHDGAVPVAVPGAKERALLADLLVHAGRVVAADRLIEDLWGERPPGNPVNTLQGRVSALRRALGPVAARLATRPPGYRLDVDPEQVDAARFERLVADADRAAARDPARALGLLAEALGLWRGPALAEFADRPWAQAEAARLEELRLAAVELRAELRLAAGRHGELVGELEALVATHPLRERPRGQLMLALYRSGRQADALRAYRETRAVLAEELGIDPSPELQRLHQAILTQDPALDAVPDGRRQPPHNLPERLTSFVGRDVELREVGKLLEQHRLVTVTGPGGAGKSSFAVELARRALGGWPDGVWLVELAALRDPGLLPEAVIAALGLGEEPGEPGRPQPAPVERLVEFAADKTLLLLLDNCEHLAGACAALAERLLRAAPGLKVLAASREVLGVAGEARWPVPPLAAPGPEEPDGSPEALARWDAVRLFAERAALADPGFRLDAAGGPAVAELCRRLDGMPLAIELAAARVHALPVGDLVERLDDRFALLAGGGRTADPRQQTLRATVDWSFQLLEEADRRLFRRLAVFAGGFTVAAAEAVCAGDGLRPEGVMDGLFRLVDRSLVVAAGGQPARFRLLETLRAYGQERLAEAGEAEAVTGRHAVWFQDLAEQAAQHRGKLRWLRLLDADYDNLRAALDWAVARGDHQTALRIGGALGWYWWMFHHEEGKQRLAGVLALAAGQPPSPQLARALQAAAMVEVLLTPTGAAVAAVRRSLELFERFGDRQAAATSRLLLGLAELQVGGGGAARLADQAEASFAEAGDAGGEATAGLVRFVADAHHMGHGPRPGRGPRAADARALRRPRRPLGDRPHPVQPRGARQGAGRRRRGGAPLRGGAGGRPRRRTDLDRVRDAGQPRQPRRPPGRRRPRDRAARRGDRAVPAHRAAPRARLRLQPDGQHRPRPRRPRARPPPAPGGARHRPGDPGMERPAHPRPARVRGGTARRAGRRRDALTGGGRARAGRPAAGDRGPGPGRARLGRARPRPRRAGRGPAGRGRGDPRARRRHSGRRRAGRGRAGPRRSPLTARRGRRPGGARERARTGHRTGAAGGARPWLSQSESKARVNLLSRSRMRNRGAVVPSVVPPSPSIESSRARWTTQGPFGRRVTPASRTRRVPSSMKNKT
jgi:predicted ATPase/DNA-binding SARP family transcriptional activator